MRWPFPQESVAIFALIRDTIARVNSRDYSAAQIDTWLGSRTTEEIAEGEIQAGYWWVCVDVDAIIGVGTAVAGEITGLYIHADHLRKGVGTALLQRMEEEVAGDGSVGEISVESTLSALAFYKAMGYEEVNRAVVGPAKLDVVNLRKRVSTVPALVQSVR